MSWTTAAGVASAGLNAVVGALAWSRGRRRPVYRALALMSLSFAWWSAAYTLAAPGFSDPLWMKLMLTPLAWLPAASLSFAWSFTGLDPAARRRRTVPLYLAGYLALGLMWAGRITIMQFHAAFIVGGLPIFATTVALLTLHWRRAPDLAERNRRGYLAAAGWILTVVGFLDFLPVGNLPYLALPNVALIVWSLLVLAAVERHHLLDLRDAARQAGLLLAGSAALGLAVVGLEWATRRLGGDLFVTLFLSSLAAMAVLPPLWDRFVGAANRLVSARQVRLDRALGDFERRSEAVSSLAEAERAAAEAAEGAWGAKAEALWEPGAFKGLDAPPGDPALSAALSRRSDPFTAASLSREGESALLAALSARGLEAGAPVARGGRRVGWLLIGAPREGFHDLAALRGLARLAGALGRAAGQAEAAQALLHADRLVQLGTMAAGIAHEIRNPLSAMLGAVELQGLPITPEQKASSLRILKEEVLRLDEILRGLLEYSAPRAKSAKCRWLEVFDRVAKLMRPDFPEGLDLSRSGPDAELAVPGTHLQQILINLLRNGARAAASGPPEGARPAVSVTLSVIGPSALLAVADNGPGIPADLMGQLFVPFSSRSPGGTGLGLATVRRLAELYGGRAWAENGPRGARFLVELPLV